MAEIKNSISNEKDVIELKPKDVMVEFKSITKIYPNSVVKVLENISFEIKKGEFLILVGPSGCGKSTCLRLLAGLEEITSGDILINGNLVNDLPPKDRDISMVFQSYALFPHLTVSENLAFGLKVRKVDQNQINTKVEDVAKLLDLEEHLQKKPGQLSGGQRQRVALGRAVIRESQVFLLDEPLSNLDAKLRSKMRTEIKKIQRSYNVATMYVTHDQVEAMTMGDRIAVLDNGKIQQVGEPNDIYNYPTNKFVAGFIGSPQMNFYNMTIKAIKLEQNDSNSFIQLENSDFSYIFKDLDKIDVELEEGMELILGIRPEDVILTKDNQESLFNASIDIIEPIGAYSIIHLQKGNSIIVCQTNETHFKYNQEVGVQFRSEKIHLFERTSELSIVAQEK